ncbi:MAG: PDZ domain-containing protein, partial [Proteobacteria bacterium]
SKTGQSAGLGFATPIDATKAVFEDLKTHGRVPRPWLGILGQRVTPQMKLYYQFKTDEGVVVVSLVERGPSQKAGLKAGDILISIEGVQVAENAAIERELYKKKPGNSVKVRVWRGLKTVDFEIKLAELPDIDDLPQDIV